MTSKSVNEYEKNPNYWDKDNVKIDNIKLTFHDGSDQESLIRHSPADMKYLGLNQAEHEFALADHHVQRCDIVDFLPWWLGHRFWDNVNQLVDAVVFPGLP